MTGEWMTFLTIFLTHDHFRDTMDGPGVWMLDKKSERPWYSRYHWECWKHGYFSSHHVDIVILQNKVFHAKEQVCRELKCKGTTSYKRFQEVFFFFFNIEYIIICPYSSLSVVFTSPVIKCYTLSPLNWTKILINFMF